MKTNNMLLSKQIKGTKYGENGWDLDGCEEIRSFCCRFYVYAITGKLA